MHPRAAAHVLAQIAALLELQGANRFKARAYEQAARAIRGVDTDDLAPLLQAGALDDVPGLGPATLAVVRDLVAEGESPLLERLRADVPDGLVELLDVPGLTAPRIHALHAALGIEGADDLEAAARDGRLATVKGFGPKTVDKIVEGIAFMRAARGLALFPRAAGDAAHLLADVRRHPSVERADLAGSLRRLSEVIADVDVVAESTRPAAEVYASFARAPGVVDARQRDGGLALRHADGARLDLTVAAPDEWAVAFWRATGSAAHVEAVEARAASLGFSLGARALRDGAGRALPLPDEAALYAALGMSWVPPELREGRGEVEAAVLGALPRLLDVADLRGSLHNHTSYSDGGASVREMAEAARARGWQYIGITDHSVGAFYAGGMKPDAVLRQHDEIDLVNEAYAADGVDFHVLKGVEADILPDGRVDYADDALLPRFDYVIGSVHSQFRMSEAAMTERVCRALESPYLTILGHPTGRLLLSRDAFAIDIDAVLEKAASTGTCVELNADSHRLDLDWRLLQRATSLGIPIEIGPDAHSTAGLDNVRWGVNVARKGWLTAAQTLNARSVSEVLAFARAKRERMS